MEQITAENTNNERLDIWLSKALQQSRSFIQKCCKQKKVLLNDNATKSSTILKKGDIISYSLVKEPLELVPSDIPLDIVYEDTNIIVINKPAGLTVHPGAGNKTHTVVNALLYYNKTLSTAGDLSRPGIIHRLDKDTSGLLLIAKNNKAHEKLAKLFQDRKINKKYIALIQGYLKESAAIIDEPIGRMPNNYQKMTVDYGRGKKAVTKYTVLKAANEKTLVDIDLLTGRTHQIRVHFAHLGHPLVGDPIYGKKGGKRQLLHAYFLEFEHPTTKQTMTFSLPFPKWAKV